VVCQNINLFIPQFLVELWLENTGLTKQGVLSADSVLLGHPWFAISSMYIRYIACKNTYIDEGY
jgi:hypothetical protein